MSFRAGNIRSYRDDVEISLLATRLAQQGVPREMHVQGLASPISVLPAAGVFGANASGKSRLLHAMADMRNLVLRSFRHGDATSRILRRPFLLDPASREAPSEFHVDLILNGTRWQYGFEVDDYRVLGEYAYSSPRGRRSLVFERELEDIRFGPAFRTSGRALERISRHNSLLLSVAGLADDENLGALFIWFVKNMRHAEISSRGIRAALTANMINDSRQRDRVLGLLRAAELGITDAEVTNLDIDPEAQEHLNQALRILHGTDGEPDEDTDYLVGDFVRLAHHGTQSDILFDPDDESAGTMVWVGLVGPVIETLDEGALLLADELDASLHPHLVQRLVALFQDPYTNPNSAQLVFNAHDVSVLGDSERRSLGRDQIWFTEKDQDGTTRLYPLSDFRPRRDEALERRYLQGRFGGVPMLNTGEFLRAIHPDLDSDPDRELAEP
ncbi:MAG: ATP-binding protein [bacterium]|nr:ATP-binding protein [bacterium]